MTKSPRCHETAGLLYICGNGGLWRNNFPIDHVTVAGRDVKAMTEALRKATGITAEYGGPHSNHATEMALASFPDGSYLELIAIQPKADPAALAAHYWHKFWKPTPVRAPGQFVPWMFRRKWSGCARTACAVTDPRRAGRKRPDGVELDWETAQVGPTNGGFFPFLIHDFTPRDNRAFPSGKPTTDRIRRRCEGCDGGSRSGRGVARYRQSLRTARAPTAGRCRVWREARLVFRNARGAGRAAFTEILAERAARAIRRSALCVCSGQNRASTCGTIRHGLGRDFGPSS